MGSSIRLSLHFRNFHSFPRFGRNHAFRWGILPQVSSRSRLVAVCSWPPRVERVVVHTSEEESMSLLAQTRFSF